MESSDELSEAEESPPMSLDFGTAVDEPPSPPQLSPANSYSSDTGKLYALLLEASIILDQMPWSFALVQV